MTVQDIQNSAGSTPRVFQEIVTVSGTIGEDITQIILNSSLAQMTVHLPDPSLPGKQMRVRNISTGTLGEHTLQCTGGDFEGVNTTMSIPPYAEVLLSSVGSQTWRVSEVRRGYIEFGVALGAFPKPAPGCGLDILLTRVAGATAGTLPAFGAGDVGSNITIAQTSTQAHTVLSFSPPRINGSSGTVTLGTQVGSSVDLIVNSTGTMYSRNLQGNGAAVS